MSTVPCYICFDYDHDDDLKLLLVGQAKNPDTPFSISDWSIKDASPQWRDEARTRIKRAHLVIVICGEHTDSASGVSVEIKIAQDAGKPYFLLAGRSGKTNKKPTAAKSDDKVYNWTWDNLKKLIAGAR